MVADPLTRRVAATPDRTALLDTAERQTAETGETTSREWTYRDLDARVDAVASRLQMHARTEENGTRQVGTLLSPHPAFVATFHAAMRLGWTVVGLDTSLSRPELDARLAGVDLDLLVCEEETEKLVLDRASCPVVSVDNGGDAESLWVMENQFAETDSERCQSAETDSERCQSVETKSTEPVPPTDMAEDDTVLVLFTSGTTGNPKGVRLTLGNLTASATASAFRLGVSPGDRWLCCLPVYHMGGLAPVFRTVTYGTTLVLQREFNAHETLRVIADHDVTGISLVPTQLSRLLDADGDSVGSSAADRPLSTLETVLLGGAPAPESLIERATAAGVSVCPTYGLTETASQVATAGPQEARTYPGTVGQPLFGTTVTVVADGEPVEPGERGELVVDGPTVTPGYLDAATTREAFGELGLHTGDVGYEDENGRLWVTGRRDELILSGGELVAPEEVAEAIRDHPDVVDAAVVGLADEDWGERVTALVVADGSPSGADIREFCRERLASYKLPKTVEFGTEIPRTASGTVDREAVREQFR